MSLIVDDPAPLINVFWWHAAERQQSSSPTLNSGEPVVQAVPVEFLDRFVEVIQKWGIRGKFSVLPYPAGLGKISEGWPGAQATEFRSSVVWREGDEWLVSIVSQCGDHIWETMENRDDSAAYVRSVADRYLTEDGRAGRLAELFRAGTPMVFHTHWQSLYSDGRGTGLRVLDEVGRRVARAWGEEVRWLKCSDLASEVAAHVDEKHAQTVSDAETGDGRNP
jgi:hypothetical protein